jgi:hypothetical protein
VVVLASLEDVGAEQQEPVVEALQHNPPDRLRAVGGVAVLLEGAEGNDVSLGGPAVGKRRVVRDEARRAFSCVRVVPEANENPVGPRGVP